MSNDDMKKALLNILAAYEGQDSLVSNQGQAMDGYSALANFLALARKVRDGDILPLHEKSLG